MKALFRQLGPAFLPYRRTLAWGITCVALTNLIALAQPLVLRFAVDDLYRGVTAEKLGRYALLLFAIAMIPVAAGIAIPVATASVHSASLENTPCLDNVGVTIVVDFHELGGGVNIRCAPGPVTSGLDALDKAGIVWESVRRFPGFVCRIAGLPGPDTEACIKVVPSLVATLTLSSYR